MTELVIGLAGSAAGAGKDTAADLIEQLLPGCQRIAFATKLRQVIEILTNGKILASETLTGEGKARIVDRAMFGVDEKEVSARLQTAFGPLPTSQLQKAARVLLFGEKMTVGRLLQLLGTEIGRDLVGPDIWVKVLEEKIHKEQIRILLVTDVRFENEARWIKQHPKSCLILVDARHRLRSKCNKELLAGRKPEHASELGLNKLLWHDFDIILNNNASVETLHAQLKASVFF